MVHESIRQALKPFDAQYTPHPADPHSTVVHIPGANHSWLFTPEGKVWQGVYGGGGPHLDFHSSLTEDNRAVARGTAQASLTLPRLVSHLVYGEKHYTTPNHTTVVRQEALNDPTKVNLPPHERISKGLHSYVSVPRPGQFNKVHRLHSSPDFTALNSDPMPPHIVDGVNTALQTGMMEPLVDELLEHHGISNGLGHFARQLTKALRY